MRNVRAKKHLGQHFLLDLTVAQGISDALLKPSELEYPADSSEHLLEIGPGMGVLTQYLITRKEFDLKVIEIDEESVAYLIEKEMMTKEKVIMGDFLKLPIESISDKPFSIIGNFPYNISNQIFFKVFENRDKVSQIVGMLQKEVAQRLTSPPGSKVYGILSVFLQAYYTAEYLFTVPPTVFNPPPKVESGVIRMVRNNVKELACDEKLFRRVVKTTFNQRRKTISNSIKPIMGDIKLDTELLRKRPEQLGVQEFIELTNMVTEALKA